MKNPKLLKELRKQPCKACGKRNDIDVHHVKSRGSGGGDEEWNLIPLCRNCHVKIHQYGISKFISKYPNAGEYLISRGWEYDEVIGKWVCQINMRV